jgi:hypothetical protein
LFKQYAFGHYKEERAQLVEIGKESELWALPHENDILPHLWMANGLISSRKSLEVGDVGNMIWSELCQKSFFQDIEIDEDYGDVSFKMHDLVDDLVQSVMGQERIYLENANMTILSKSTYHISYHSMICYYWEKDFVVLLTYNSFKTHTDTMNKYTTVSSL